MSGLPLVPVSDLAGQPACGQPVFLNRRVRSSRVLVPEAVIVIFLPSVSAAARTACVPRTRAFTRTCDTRKYAFRDCHRIGNHGSTFAARVNARRRRRTHSHYPNRIMR